MTAPTRASKAGAQQGATRQRTRAAATTTEEIPAPPRPRRGAGEASRGRTTAAERAYKRRAQRAELLQRSAVAEPQRARQRATTKLGLRWPRSRASFVLIMMGLLAVGVATTLLLSTQAIADSYRLESIRQDNAGLAERAEQLQRDVTKQESASSLAQKAKELGMVPGGDPARIVVNPDGSTTVVGEPKKATVPAAPAPATPPPAEPPAHAPIEGDAPAVPAPDAQAQAAPEGQQPDQAGGQ
ncbi:hypothetical protein [Amycolatopsis nigrescens]|uniref:hypothetical protein n=1 Tax=Amycolatopsis nigrescens TaxID=381445 RepID=UPI00036A7837|nr:hypothetical protein [Amycolatopsis nigrescens]